MLKQIVPLMVFTPTVDSDSRLWENTVGVNAITVSSKLHVELSHSFSIWYNQ